ncbi:MAG: DUF2771 family protein [Mycobacteriales bacterium]
MPARRPLALALTGAALLSLTGCQKPTPGVTLASDGRSVHTEANAYCRGGRFLTRENDCPGSTDKITVLRVTPEARVSVDVDSDLADSGWYLYDEDAQRSYAVHDDHYTSFIADFTNRPLPGVIRLQIRQVDHVPHNPSDLPKITGLWKLQLVQQ